MAMNSRYAAVATVVSVSLMAAIAASAKLLASHYSIVLILLVQYILMTVLCAPFSGVPAWSEIRRLLPIVPRVCLMIGSGYFLYIAVYFSSLSISLILFYTYPAMNLLLFMLVYRVDVRSLDFLIVLINIAGLVIVFGVEGFNPYAVFAVLSALCVALRSILDRHISLTGIALPRIQFLICATASVMLLPVVVVRQFSSDRTQQLLAWPTPHEILLFVGIACAAYVAQRLILRIIADGQIVVFSVFCYWEIIAGIVLGYMIFDETLQRGEIVGVLLIVLTSYWAQRQFSTGERALQRQAKGQR